MNKRIDLCILLILATVLTACAGNTAVKGATVPANIAASAATTEPVVSDPANPGSDAEEVPSVSAGAPGAASVLDEDYPDSIPVFMQLVIGTMLLENTPQAVTAEQARELLPLWQMFRAVRASNTPPSLEEIEAALEPIQAAMTPEQISNIRSMLLTQEDVKGFNQSNGIVGQGSGSGTGPNQNLSVEERRIQLITSGGKAQVDELIRRLEIWTA